MPLYGKFSERLYTRFRRVTSKGDYLPEIDGLRFLAIFFVFIFHAYGFFLSKNPDTVKEINKIHHFFHFLCRDGDKGVPIFFTISGFILAIPFGNAILKNGRPVSLRKFFLRRLTRLEPPYILALLILFTGLLLLGTYSFHTLFPSLLASIFYSHNILFGTPLVTVVAWSLEIEIQFYLLVPVLIRVYYLPSFWRRAILLGVMCGFPVLRQFYPTHTISLYGYIEYFLGGILIADLYLSYDNALFNKRYFSYLGIPFFLMLVIYDHNTRLDNRFFFPLIVMIFFLFVLWNRDWKALFSIKIISIIGGMCYSIYLLHYSIISLFWPLPSEKFRLLVHMPAIT